MKKFLLLIAAVAVLGSASAQTNKQTQKLTFGPKLGFNIADLNFKTNEGVNLGNLKAAFTIGGFVEYRTCNWFALSTDLLYSLQGMESNLELKIGTFKTNTKIDYTLQYINIPILANFYVTKGLALKTGIQPGFLIAASQKITTDGDLTTNDVKSAFKSLDIAIPVGISYTFKMGLMIDARYNISLTDIASNSLKTEFKTEKEGDALKSVYNSVFTLSVGWKF